MKCATCGEASGARYCSAECEQTAANILAAHRKGRRQPRSRADFDGPNLRTDPDPPQPAVLYGLLTEADVRELERRVIRWAAAGRVFPTTDEPEAERGAA